MTYVEKLIADVFEARQYQAACLREALVNLREAEQIAVALGTSVSDIQEGMIIVQKLGDSRVSWLGDLWKEPVRMVTP